MSCLITMQESIKIDSYDALPEEKTLNLHTTTIIYS